MTGPVQLSHTGKKRLRPDHDFRFPSSVIRRGYAEFEQRAGQVKAPRGAKTALVENAINSFPAQFTITELEQKCPGVSRDMLRYLLNRLQQQKRIKCVKLGRNSLWQKM